MYPSQNSQMMKKVRYVDSRYHNVLDGYLGVSILKENILLGTQNEYYVSSDPWVVSILKIRLGRYNDLLLHRCEA